MNCKKSFFITVALFALVVFSISAENYQTKRLYHGGGFGETIELTEYSNGSECCLELFMTDDGSKYNNKFDPNLPTVCCIYSKWFSNSAEYSNAINASKDFCGYAPSYFTLADMKDICDIAPCCKSDEYKIATAKNGKKYIYIEYECSDLELLFEIAKFYTKNGRDYVMEKYAR